MMDSLIVDIVENRIGRLEITILLRDQLVYLPFNDIFDWLRLKYEYDWDQRRVTGFIITKDSSYTIDFAEKKGIYKENVITFREIDYILFKDKIFLNEKLFRSLFNWDIKYNEKKLEVILKSKAPFPQIQQKQRQRRLQRQIETAFVESDLSVKMQPSVFNLGKFTYNVNVYNFRKNDIRARYNFLLGGQFLFGDFETSIRGITKEKIKQRDLKGFIRYPFFQNRILNQITIGDIQKLSFVGGNLFGIDITNIPAERRYEFSSYTITNKINSLSEYYLTGRMTSPLYITTKNDTTVSIPTTLYYGYTQYIERFYDWYGQEKVKEAYIIIPQSMVPPKMLDYRISFGKLRQQNYPEYSSLDLWYGATDYITLGSGIEYTNRKNLKGKFFPYTYSTVRFYDNIYGILEYSPFLLGRTRLNYQTIDGKLINFSYSLYTKNRVLNPRNMTSYYGFGIFLPFKMKFINYLVNLNYDHNNLENGREQFFRAGLGSYWGGLNVTYNFFWSSLMTKYFIEQLIKDEETDENILLLIERKNHIKVAQSDVSVSFAPTYFSNLSTGLRFNHLIKRINLVFVGVNIYLFANIGVNLNVERDLINNQIFAIFSMTFNPNYTSISASSMIGNKRNYYSASIRGELIGSTQTFDLLFNRFTQTRRGYFLSSAFFDLNNNNIRDKDEQFLEDNIRISTLRGVGTSIPFIRKYDRYNYLLAGENYRDYILNVTLYDLDDPLLVPKYTGIKIKSEPNKLKRIEIPVVTGGIISGNVVDEEGNPIGGLKIKLSKEDKIRKIVLTNSRGEFEFPTVPPGDYSVYIDEEVLKASNAISEPAVQEIQITGEPEKGFVSTHFVVKFK